MGGTRMVGEVGVEGERYERERGERRGEGEAKVKKEEAEELIERELIDCSSLRWKEGWEVGAGGRV